MKPLFRHLSVLQPKPLTRLAGQLSALVAGDVVASKLMDGWVGETEPTEIPSDE